jgi:hypothetical protein
MKTDEPCCRECGCTETLACMSLDGPCHWVEAGPEVWLCSACADKLGSLTDGDTPDSTAAGSPAFTPADVKALKECPPIGMELDAPVAFYLLAALQLACRHPGMKGTVRDHVIQIALGIQERLSITTNLAELCAAGWDEAMDVPSDPAPQAVADRPAIIIPGSPDFHL